jgi:hypothetical protein
VVQVFEAKTSDEAADAGSPAVPGWVSVSSDVQANMPSVIAAESRVIGLRGILVPLTGAGASMTTRFSSFDIVTSRN